MLVIEPRARDLDGLVVARLLPAVARQLVGPFIFLDHFGPALLRPPQALDIRPHPHIGLATITYPARGRDPAPRLARLRAGHPARRGQLDDRRPGQADRAAYVVAGGLRAGGSLIQAGRLALLRPNAAPRLVAAGATRALLLGGEPLGERRHAWWNFVSSSRERIEEAKAAWAGGRFPKVPGDEVEFTPLPARHAHPGATE